MKWYYQLFYKYNRYITGEIKQANHVSRYAGYYRYNNEYDVMTEQVTRYREVMKLFTIRNTSWSYHLVKQNNE